MNQNTLELTVEVVTAFVSHNPIAGSELPALILAVHRALARTFEGVGRPIADTAAGRPPAVSVRRSVTPDHLICLEDGKKLKALKRHLRAEHNMDPASYRSKWG